MEGPTDVKNKLPYAAQIDGLRGLSVLAVIFFHLRFAWADGGYLGVEAFFVVSGYLITSLLLHEFAFERRISLKRFWLRRARRLLPVLFVLLGAVTITSLILARDYLQQLRVDTAAALAYITNWHLIFSDQAYFQAIERQSPLLHLWSLAIEEQFYLVWPLVLTVLLKIRSFKFAVMATGTLIVASLALGAWYYLEFGLDRAYYGTDSRLAGLLVGSLAAIFLPLHETKRYANALNLSLKKALAWLAWPLLGGVLVMLSQVAPGSSWPFFGGLLIFDVLVIALTLALIFNPQTWLGRLLGGPLLVWLGTRSYGLYLWHWPIFQFTRPGTDIAITGWRNTLIRLGLTVAATELSYRLIERVIRYKSPKDRSPQPRRMAAGMAAGMLAVSLAFVFWPQVLAGQWPTAESLALDEARRGQLGGVEQAQIVETEPAPKPKPQRPDGLVTVVGDSVVLGAAKSIGAQIGKPLVLDAKISRFPKDLPDELRSLAKEDKLGQTVVVAIGTNGVITAEDFESIMSILENKQVVWVTPRGEKTWIRDSINILRKEVPKLANAKLADWAKLSAKQTKWFVSDGIHVSEAGAEALAGLLAESIKL